VGRPVVLSNGQLFVGLDENGLVHDFYYPYVGLENLTNARSLQHKIGVFSDGVFSWTDDGNWEVEVLFESDALISQVTLRSAILGVTLRLQDTIDNENNVFVRQIKICNEREQTRDIRLFMHQVFQISRGGRSDTAMYVPENQYILDYKGRFCLLVSGQWNGGETFDQYAVGNYAIEGKAGTFKDAEDGQLSDNPVEHGGVDSVLRFKTMVKGRDEKTVDYWIVAAGSQTDAEAVHDRMRVPGAVSELIHKSRQDWQEWLHPDSDYLRHLPEREKLAVQRSLLIIKAHCDSRGSILASGDSSIFNYGRDYYCYCWPRDAAYAMWPLIRTGHFDEARQFFLFARDVMHPDGYMMHKYQPDRAIGSTWHPLVHNRHSELAIQEDETACLLFMLNELYEANKDLTYIQDLYHTFVQRCANFLVKYVDGATGLPHASYDLWEQRFATFTYTVCTVIAGLEAAAKLAEAVDEPPDAVRWRKAAEEIRGHLDQLYHPDGYFRKSLLVEGDNVTTDDSLDVANMYGPFMYAKVSIRDERLLGTVKKVENELFKRGPIGGVIRYVGDDYFLGKPQYGGNPWIVCTLWLAQYYISAGRAEEARDLIEWALDRQQPSGVLSEQFDPENGSSLGVAPLVWSHSELVNTLLDYYQR
jgi:GH15 family glucan-1,4-alpha-glucosidase